jgi:small GTP-binding protein
VTSNLNTASPGAFQEVTVTGADVKLQLWDTAGQERFQALGSVYYRAAGAVLVFFAIDDRHSFVQAGTWLRDAQQHVQRQGDTPPLFVLVGNKADLRATAGAHVSNLEATGWATAHAMEYYEVSAKVGTQVTDLFQHVTDAAPKVMPLSKGPKQASSIVIKVVLLGEAGVGKTSVHRRFTENKFSNQYLSTIGADFAVHSHANVT